MQFCIICSGIWCLADLRFFTKITKAPYEGEKPPDVDDTFLTHYFYYSFKIGFYVVLAITGPLLFLFGRFILWTEIKLIFDL
jgi:hypothetical protein